MPRKTSTGLTDLPQTVFPQRLRMDYYMQERQLHEAFLAELCAELIPKGYLVVSEMDFKALASREEIICDHVISLTNSHTRQSCKLFLDADNLYDKREEVLQQLLEDIPVIFKPD